MLKTKVHAQDVDWERSLKWSTWNGFDIGLRGVTGVKSHVVSCGSVAIDCNHMISLFENIVRRSCNMTEVLCRLDLAVQTCKESFLRPLRLPADAVSIHCDGLHATVWSHS